MQIDKKHFDFQTGEILVFNKPLDWTSFDLVNKVRYHLCRKMKVKKLKVGHAGTLDPKATGIMVICTGKSTKNIDLIQAEEKEYIATLKLGATTPSYDLETEEDQTFESNHITETFLRETLKKFVGTIEQVPPEYSAIKVDGKRAYEFARKGKPIELKAKTLVIKEIELLRYDHPEAQIRIVCSKGTYIRALARDIGQALESGAYLTGLIRTRVGEYSLQNCWEIPQFMDVVSEYFHQAVEAENENINKTA